MNLEEIRDEVVAAGLKDYEGDALVDLWVNRALREIENRYAWPWRVKATAVSHPYTISDLQHVYKVTCDGQTVDYEDYRNVVDRNPEMDQTGDPTWWFMVGSELRVWPATEKELSVTYLRTPQVLDADLDVPDVPEEFHELIVTGARIRGFRHTQSFEAAALERQEWLAGIAELLGAYARANFDTDLSIQRTGAPGDY